MLDKEGFDLWADGYDKSVGASDGDNTYPFAGYKNVLGSIYKKVTEKSNAVILDLSFGTGTLTTKLYERGYTIYGQDFSSRMIELASAKMPKAHLYKGDFSKGLSKPILQQRYDFILATYSLHHLTDPEKVAFIKTLQGLLKEDGKLLIGDIAFETREALNECRLQAADEWDGDEFYFAADELRKAFPRIKFECMSYCAGIITVTR